MPLDLIAGLGGKPSVIALGGGGEQGDEMLQCYPVNYGSLSN
jgi:hypothetical protein